MQLNMAEVESVRPTSQSRGPAGAATSSVMRRPAAAARAQRSRSPPLLTRPSARAANFDITYASDCSGLDGGAVALKQMGVTFRHAFASEKNASAVQSHPLRTQT